MTSFGSIRGARAGHAARRALVRALVVAAITAAPLAAFAAEPAAGATSSPGICRFAALASTGPDPYTIRLVPTANANGASGAVRLRFGGSPFGVSVSRDGRHVYEAALSATGLPPVGGAVPVAWAATPELDRVRRLGVLDGEGRLAARIDFNKFLVFITAEPSGDVERWTGPILLRGISPSGRMHTMAGHGPFAGEPCGSWSPF